MAEEEAVINTDLVLYLSSILLQNKLMQKLSIALPLLLQLVLQSPLLVHVKWNHPSCPIRGLRSKATISVQCTKHGHLLEEKSRTNRPIDRA